MTPSGHELNVARVQIRNGRLREAKQALHALLARSPGDGEALWMLAELHVALGEAEQGIARAQEAQAARPESGDSMYRFAVGLHQQGRPAPAADWYRLALRANPRHLEAWCNLGAALQACGRPAEAVEAYRRALELKPDFPEVLGNLGNALLALRDFGEASRVLSRAVSLRSALPNLWNSLGISLKGLGRTDEARGAYEKAITLNPGYADAHANLGTLHKAAGRPDFAETAYRRALELAPGRADVLNNLGAVLSELGRYDEAEPLLRQALEQEPNFADALCNLGNALLASDDVEAADRSLRRSLELRPDNVEALCNLGNVHLARNRLDDALACYEHAGSVSPGHAEALFNQSLVYLARGDFARGWPLYEHRLGARGKRPARTFPGLERLLPGAPLAGRTILVHAEQGLGDTLQFARLLPALRSAGARVRVEVQAPLVGLISASRLADSVHGPRDTPADCNVYCPLPSLPWVLGFDPFLKSAPIPYLAIPAAARTQWSPRFQGSQGPRVGIVWSGNPKHRNDRRRSIALERLLKAFRDFGGTLVSLQKERSAADLAMLGQMPGLLDLGAESRDFSDTAAVVGELDLVVTVDTSVAHLAGALGKPTWVLLPFAPDWRWMLEREDNPWYPSLRLLRQPAIGDWDSVVQRIGNELREIER